MWNPELPNHFQSLLINSDYLILHNEGQHLKDLQNSVSQYFSNEFQCMVLQNHAWVKHLFDTQYSPMDPNLTKYEKATSKCQIWHWNLTFQKLPLAVVSKNIHNYLKRFMLKYSWGRRYGVADKVAAWSAGIP